MGGHTLPRVSLVEENINTFKEVFNSEYSRLSLKHSNYFGVYDRYLSRLVRPSVLEIGVWKGGSIDMWKKCLGSPMIYGVDINPECRSLESEGVRIIIGDQGSDDFLSSLVSEVGDIDIVIDDGSHVQSDVIKSFKHLWPILNDGGVYIIEDVQTSYWDEYGGGLRREGTVMEYFKSLCDSINSFHTRRPMLDGYDFSMKCGGIHFHDNIIVIEKEMHGFNHPVYKR